MTPRIYPGRVCRNYREVCEALGEKVTTGGARQNQELRWAEYFTWYKHKREYHFTGVKKPYRPPSPYMLVGRHSRHIAPLLCSLVASAKHGKIPSGLSSEYRQLIMPSSELYIRLGICNSRFREWKKTKEFLAKFELEHLTTEEARAAYFTVWSRIWEVVSDTIATLDRQHIIAWTRPAYQVKHESAPEILRLAHHDSTAEAEAIHTIYGELLLEFKCKNLFEIQLRKQEEDFYAQASMRLAEVLGIIYHTKVYHITFHASQEDRIKDHMLRADEVNEGKLRLQSAMAEWAQDKLKPEFWDILDLVFAPILEEEPTQ